MHPRDLVRLIDAAAEALDIGPTTVLKSANVDPAVYRSLKNNQTVRQTTIDKILKACRISRPPAAHQRWLTIWTNVPITRRKTFHIITDSDGETIYRNRHFWPCVEFLDSIGVKAYLIRCGYSQDAKGFISAETKKD